jgi:plastocyanin
MRKNLTVCCVAALLVLGGCGRSNEEAGKQAQASKEPGQVADEVNGASITGKVNFTGQKPVLREIDFSANPACQKMHSSPVHSEEVVVNGNGTLANAFVWLKDGVPAGRWTPSSKTVVIDQQGCLYKPHVSGVMIDQPLEFRNSDDTNHNIHPMPQKNREFNESEPPKDQGKIKTFDREEVMIPVKCNIHPWMRAYIGVVRHPFFAVTGDDGTFTIKGVPPGTYTVEVWQEKYGTQDMNVTVAAKESKTLDFTLGASSTK